MTIKTQRRSRWSPARLALLLLFLIAFLPGAAILLVAGVASLMGCSPGQKQVCAIGPIAVSQFIDWALLAGGASILYSAVWRIGFYAAIVAGLLLGYVTVIQGWTRATSRLLLGLAVALCFSLLPLAAPGAAITLLAKKDVCDPTGSAACLIFGGKVDKAYAAVSMVQPPIFDTVALLAFGSFCVFAIMVVIGAMIPAMRRARRVQVDS